MGLDVTAYKNLAPANGNEAFDEHGELRYEDGYVKFYENPDFQGRAEGIDTRIAYKPEDSTCLCAGSYGGYNKWRDMLAELAGYPLTEYKLYGATANCHSAACWNGAQGPFAELINFSDCEGTIGPKVSAKLAADFATFRSKADSHPDEYFRRKYVEWQDAFEFVGDNGAVEFH